MPEANKGPGNLAMLAKRGLAGDRKDKIKTKDNTHRCGQCEDRSAHVVSCVVQCFILILIDMHPCLVENYPSQRVGGDSKDMQSIKVSSQRTMHLIAMDENDNDQCYQLYLTLFPFFSELHRVW